jgi:hypothetical protein
LGTNLILGERDHLVSIRPLKAVHLAQFYDSHRVEGAQRGIYAFFPTPLAEKEGFGLLTNDFELFTALQ